MLSHLLQVFALLVKMCVLFLINPPLCWLEYILLPVKPWIQFVSLLIFVGPAALTGLGLLLLTVPMNMWAGTQQKVIQDSMLKLKDERIKLVNQILNGMKVQVFITEWYVKKKKRGTTSATRSV